MMKALVPVLMLAALVGACDKSPERPTGIATWAEAKELAEAFVLRGDVAAVRAHSNFSGVPSEALRQVTTMLDGWSGVSEDLRHVETQVMTFPEYEAFRQESRNDLPDFIRHVPSRVKWNVKPDKVIVFTFSGKGSRDSASVVSYSAGAYERNGLWYFATSFGE